MKSVKIILFSLFLAVSIVSCSTIRYVEVPVETIKKEYINTVTYDSIYIHDSIDRYIKGDTVFLTKFKYINKYILKTDTVLKQDTIPHITKVEVPVEVNKIYWYQYVLIYTGLIAILFLVLWLLIKYIKKK